MNSPTSLSRRRFLAQTALISTAPWLLRRGYGQTSPANRIQLGCIGLGVQGRGLMGGFLGHKEVRVVAVCDVDTHRREDGRQRVNAHYARQTEGGAAKPCAAFEDYRELVARPDIDAVVIATPDHWHALTSIAAALAGKDIYCEKPLCKSVREAQAIVRAVRQKGRMFQTGSMQRSMREFRVACELVRNGVLGPIDHVDVTVGGPAIPCDLPEEAAEPGLNWDLWLGPAPKRPYNSILSPRGVHNDYPNWRHYREYGGGAVTDFGAHHFDIAQWGLGRDGSGPVEIVAPADGTKAEFGVKLRYADGVQVVHARVPGHNDITFYGRDGVVQVDRGRISVRIGDRTIAPGEQGLRGQLDQVEKEFLANAKVQLYRSGDHLNDWLGAIRSRKPPICPAEIGASTATLCNLVNLAYYHGRSMKWDPAAEQFTEGTGDPAWLDVPHRAPWDAPFKG